MTWIKIAHQNKTGQPWVAERKDRSIDFYRHKYDLGEGEIATKKVGRYGGYDLMYEQNTPPYRPREIYLRWSTARDPKNDPRASGGAKKGIGKYE
jgi:hypothetical protein